MFSRSKDAAPDHVIVPTKLKSLDNVSTPSGAKVWAPGEALEGQTDIRPDNIALHTDMLVATIAHLRPKHKLREYNTTLKDRSAAYMQLLRKRKPEKSAEVHLGSGWLDEWSSFFAENDETKKKCDERMGHIREEIKTVTADIERICRDLTVCDQQEFVLKEREQILDMNSRDEERRKRTEPQLTDIDHFRKTNAKSKAQYLVHRDQLEQNRWKLQQEFLERQQQRNMVESRTQLLKQLTAGSKARTDPTRGLKIASSKHEELVATYPETLASKGNFEGFREVVSISDRALQDISSALKEVSASVPGADGYALEEVLEASLKIRKEINALITDKLTRSEVGGETKETRGMLQFFEETRADKGGVFARAREML